MRFMTRGGSRPRQILVLYIDVFGGWRWEHFDERGEARDSRESFDSRGECLLDAQRNGLAGRERPHARRVGTPAASAHRAAALADSGSEPNRAGAHASTSAA